VRLLAIGTSIVVVLLVALAGGFYLWAVARSDAQLARVFDIPSHDFPLPSPLSDAEAVARGRHLAEARYACGFCHGSDFGGGVMIDDALMGTFKGPNLTTGSGSVTAGYTAGDWDRKVRHGVNREGRPGVMPSVDYFRMSDQELGDLVSYIRSLPPIDRVVPPVTYGPLGRVLAATGQFRYSVDLHPGHDAPHVVEPPAAGPTPEFGGHIAGVCTGCHRQTFEGGPVQGGPPDWPPARNLTPHESGLKSWTYEDFVKLMRVGLRPDGTPTRVPMAEVLPLGNAMTDVEMQALWAYFGSLPPLPDGK
jgi:mono/diheme cytochrome c family protein